MNRSLKVIKIDDKQVGLVYAVVGSAVQLMASQRLIILEENLRDHIGARY